MADQDPNNLTPTPPNDEIPGGPAIEPTKGPTEPTPPEIPGAFEKASAIGKEATGEIGKKAIQKTAKEAASRVAKKVSAQAIKSAALAAWASLTAAVGPYAAVIIVALILIVLVAVPSFGIIQRAWQGFWGNQKIQAVDYSNHEHIQELNQLAKYMGTKTPIESSLVIELANKIAQRIESGEISFSNDDEAKKAIGDLIAKAEELQNDPSSGQQKKVREAIAHLVDLYGSNPLPLEGAFASPVGDISPTKFNNTLHGRSSARPENHSGHNVFKGFSSPGTGDAVDIKIGSNKPVYAMFDGKLAIPTWSKEKAVTECLVLQSEEKGLEAWYCHVKDKKSGSVSKGEQIAIINNVGHLHLEVWVGDKSIHTTVSDLASKKYSQLGHYLWDHIVRIFDL